MEGGTLFSLRRRPQSVTSGRSLWSAQERLFASSIPGTVAPFPFYGLIEYLYPPRTAPAPAPSQHGHEIATLVEQHDRLHAQVQALIAQQRDEYMQLETQVRRLQLQQREAQGLLAARLNLYVQQREQHFKWSLLMVLSVFVLALVVFFVKSAFPNVGTLAEIGFDPPAEL